MKPFFTIIVFIITFNLLGNYNLFGATTYTWTGTTSSAWETTTNWSPNGNPGSATGDIVIIPALANQPILTITPANALASLTISSAPTTLTINSATLTVTGAFNMSALGAANTNTITGTGTLSCGSFSIDAPAGTPAGNMTITFISTISNFLISGNLTINGKTASGKSYSPQFNHTSGSVTVGGTLTFAGTTANVSYIMGNSSPTLNLGNATPVTIPSGTFTATGTGATVNYTTAGSQNIFVSNYNNLGISGGGNNVKTVGGAMTINGTLTIASSTTLSFGTTARIVTIASTGNINNSGTINMSGSNAAHYIKIAANSITNLGTITNGTGNFVEFTVTSGGQTIPSNTYNNLKLDNTSNTNTAAGNLTVNGTITIPSGGTLNMSTYQLLGTLGTISNSGTIKTASTANPPIPTGKTWGGTIQYDNATGYVSSGTYSTFIMTDGSGSLSVIGGNLSISNLTIPASGILDMGTNVLSTATTVTGMAGTIKTANTSAAPIPNRTWTIGTIEYNGTATQYMSSTSINFYNVTISNTVGVTLTANAANSGTLTINSGGILNLATFIWSSKGHTVINGSYTASGTGRLKFIAASPVVNHLIGGTGTYGSLEIGDPSTIISNITTTGEMFVEKTLTIGNSTTSLNINVDTINLWVYGGGKSSANGRLEVGAFNATHELTAKKINIGNTAVVDMYNNASQYCNVTILMTQTSGDRYFAGSIQEFNNLTLRKVASSFQTQSTLSTHIYGNLTIDGENCQLWLDPGSTITLNGNILIVNTSSFFNTMTTGKLLLTGSSSGHIIECHGSLQSFELDDVNGATLACSLNMWSNITITNGTLDVTTNNYDIHMIGHFTNNGTFNSRAGTLYFELYIPDAATYSSSLLGTSWTSINSALNNVIIVDPLKILVGPSSSNYYVKGNFTNNGTYTPNSGTVTFKGSTSQVIGGTASITTFNNAIIDNSSGVNLDNNISVSTALTLTTGILNTGSYYADLLTTGTISEGASATAPTSYVTGTVKVRRTLIQNVANTFGGIGLEITEANIASNITNITRLTGTSPYSGAVKRKFTITPTTDVGLNGTLKFYYFDHEIVVSDANYELHKYISDWITQNATILDAPNNKLTLTGITDFSDWTASDPTFLPIELLSLNAKSKPNGVIVEWETASEENNDFFTLYRSNDGVNFSPIYKIEGAGTSSINHNYSYFDESIYYGTTYYKLAQTDYNGTTTYSQIITNQLINSNFEIIKYTNDMSSICSFELLFSDNSISNEITITNMIGSVLYQEIIEKSPYERIDIQLSPGVYIISNKSNNTFYKQRFVVK